MIFDANSRVAVIGLGYVGLPLAVALARSFDTIGVDINAERVAELRAGHDRTREVDAAGLAVSNLRYSTEIADARGAAGVHRHRADPGRRGEPARPASGDGRDARDRGRAGGGRGDDHSLREHSLSGGHRGTVRAGVGAA